MTADDERTLLHQARRGSNQAFGRLVDAHMRQAYVVAFRFVRDQHLAEEIVQESFVRAFRTLHSFRGDSGFGTWMHRIVVNLSINMLRRTRHRQTFVEQYDESTHETNGHPSGDEDALRSDLIRMALTDLPDLQRQVVVLRHLEGHSTREVSRILRCSEGTVKTHLFRGLRKLREKLGFLREEIA
jgi:RNA polymerase sigma-70 factor (ECF subfamily)